MCQDVRIQAVSSALLPPEPPLHPRWSHYEILKHMFKDLYRNKDLKIPFYGDTLHYTTRIIIVLLELKVNAE